MIYALRQSYEWPLASFILVTLLAAVIGWLGFSFGLLPLWGEYNPAVFIAMAIAGTGLFLLGVGVRSARLGVFLLFKHQFEIWPAALTTERDYVQKIVDQRLCFLFKVHRERCVEEGRAIQANSEHANELCDPLERQKLMAAIAKNQKWIVGNQRQMKKDERTFFRALRVATSRHLPVSLAPRDYDYFMRGGGLII